MKISLLSRDDIAPFSNKQLDVINKYGAHAIATDLTLALGGDLRLTDGKSLKKRATCYLTKTIEDNLIYYYSPECGGYYLNKVSKEFKRFAVRPVVKLDDISFNLIVQHKHETSLESSVFEVEFGEYPQWAPNEKMQEELTKHKDELKETGKVYTIDMSINERQVGSYFKKFKEFSYKGKKYIYLPIKARDTVLFSNNKSSFYNKLYYNNYVWIEVSPVTWLIDFKNKQLISENCLLAGTRFDSANKNCTFSESEIYRFLRKYLLNELGLKNALAIAEINKMEQDINNHFNNLENLIENDETLSKEELELLKDALSQAKNEKVKKR